MRMQEVYTSRSTLRRFVTPIFASPLAALHYLVPARRVFSNHRRFVKRQSVIKFQVHDDIIFRTYYC